MNEPALLVDEMSDYTFAQSVVLARRKLLWWTAYEEDGERRRGTIVAGDGDAARKLARERGLGEEVQGLVTVVHILGDASTSQGPGEVGARGGTA